MAVYDLNYDYDRPRNIGQAIVSGLNKRRINQQAIQEQSLARMKAQAEIQKLQNEAKSFGQPLPTDPRTGQPLFYRLGSSIQKNPLIKNDYDESRKRYYDMMTGYSEPTMQPPVQGGLPQRSGIQVMQAPGGGQPQTLPKDQYGFFSGQQIQHSNGKNYTYRGNNQWEES